MIKFNPGDKVKCIKLKIEQGNEYILGKIYTFDYYPYESHNQFDLISLKETSNFYGYVENFIPAEKKKNPTYKECLEILNDNI